MIPMNKKRLIIIDANAVIHRAFHALPPLKTKDGEVVNAVYGFLLFFLRTIKDFNPDYIVAAFDYPAPTFRHKKYKLYKAKRKKAPKELYDQIPKVKKILEDFGVKTFEKSGFEADDIIGTVSEKTLGDVEVIILTGDLDALQLINENIKVYALRKGIKNAILYGEKEVAERYGGLTPKQLIDFKSLRGDPSDNIPGVFGIGEKSAVELIKKFGSLEELYDRIKEVKISLQEKLLKNKKQAFISKNLVIIDKNMSIKFSLKDCEWKGYNKEVATRELERYEFYSLINKINRVEEEKKIKPKKEINNNLTLW
jgi:DNA polymerase I